MSVSVNPIIDAFSNAVNGIMTFFSDLDTNFFGALSSMQVPAILGTVAALGIMAYAIARVLGVDLFGLMRSLFGGLVSRVTGAL